MKKLLGITLAVLLILHLPKVSGNHTVETANTPILEIQDPFGYKIIVYLWVLIIGLMGGLSGYIRKLKNNYNRFSIAEVIGECVISSVVAIITFWLCEWGRITGPLQAALIGLASHMGSRALFQMENRVLNRIFNQLAEVTQNEQSK